MPARVPTTRRRAPVAAVTAVALSVAAALVGPAPVGAAVDPPPPVAWATSVAGAGDDNASGVAVDATGNSFVTGKFGGTATFGAGPSAQTRTAVGGSRDAYLARYAPDGSLDWVVTAGSTGYDEGRDLIVDKAGNVYVTGSFTRTATFGSGPGAVTLSSAAPETSDVFLAKYDAATGELRWVVRGGGTGNDVGFGVALDNGGNPFISGQITGVATFGSRVLTAAGGTDVLVARYTATGGLQWAVRAGGTGNEYGAAAAMDASGRIHVVGPMTGTGFWGWGVQLTSAGGFDAWLATWGPNGALVRAQRFGGPGYDSALGVAVDPAGAAYVVGSFSGTATAGSGPAAPTVTSAGGTDVLVAAFDPAGAPRWAQRGGGTGGDLASVVTLDPTGAPVITGTYVGPATFGVPPDDATVGGAGGTDVVVARLDADTGALSWLTTAGGTGGDVGLGVAVAPDGAVTAVGLYTAPMAFPGPGGGTTLPFTGIRDIYVARYAS